MTDVALVVDREEAARRLAVTTTYVKYLAETRQITEVRQGKRRSYHADDLKAYRDRKFEEAALSVG